MHNWKNKRVKISSSTDGKSKGDNCKANWMKKFYFSNAKAHKDKQYPTYLRLSLKLNKLD